MGGHIVIPLVMIVTACGVAVYLLGSAELDEILARWRAERADREAMDEWERMKADLAPTFPRSLP